MSKVETVHYDRAYVEKHIKKVISNEHWRLWMEEQTAGQRLYDKFGEWKKEHPKNPIARPIRAEIKIYTFKNVNFYRTR